MYIGKIDKTFTHTTASLTFHEIPVCTWISEQIDILEKYENPRINTTR